MSTVSCSDCGTAVDPAEMMGSYCVPCAAKRRPDRVSADGGARHADPRPESDGGLFSDGFFGLLNKGPVGWILFGLIGGALWAAYQNFFG